MSSIPDRSLRRPDAPRRVRHGIRLKRKEGVESLPPAARAWLDLVERRASPQARLLGLEYATAGQVAAFAPVVGGFEGLVQGRAPRPYAVALTIETLSRDEWDQVIRAMADEALYTAKLLAGELPTTVEEPFAAISRTLVPRSEAELTVRCDCGEPMPCKHAVAIGCLAAERIEVEPPILLTLRGLPAERVLERLQEARSSLSASALASGGSGRRGGSAPADGSVRHALSLPGASSLPPIESCLHEFWRPGRTLADFEAAPPGNHAPHALLRRLGPSPLGGRFPLVGLLASAYDTIRAYAERLRRKEIP